MDAGTVTYVAMIGDMPLVVADDLESAQKRVGEQAAWLKGEFRWDAESRPNGRVQWELRNRQGGKGRWAKTSYSIWSTPTLAA